MDPDPMVFDGSWEQKNRNITAAAFTGLAGIGALYFNLQSYLALIFIAVYQSFEQVELRGDFFEIMKAAFNSFKIPILAALVMTQYGAMLFPVIWITRRWHTSNVKQYIRLKPVSFAGIILPVLITLMLQPCAYFISSFMMDVFSVPESFRNMGDELFTASGISEYFILVFIIAVTPAICEEVFFRGYVQRTMERTLGRKSFIITGILFGLFHMQPLSLLVLSLLGILISYFYYRSRSLYPSMAAHFTNNFIAITLLFYGAGEIPFLQEPGFLLMTISFLTAAFLFALYLKITAGAEMQELQETASGSPAN